MVCPQFTVAAGTIIVAIIIPRAEPITVTTLAAAPASVLMAATIAIGVAPLPGIANPLPSNKMCVVKFNAVVAELTVETHVPLHAIAAVLAVADADLVVENN